MARPEGILVIDARVPELDRSAGDRALADILDTLLRLGRRVTFLPHDRLLPQPWTARLERSGVEVLGPEVRINRWLRAEGPRLGHVLLARPSVARRYLGQVLRRTSARVLYFTHDLHFLRAERRAAVEDDPRLVAMGARLRRVEAAIFEAVDSVLATSDEEAATIRAMAPGAHVTVLPTWVVDGGPVEGGGPAARRPLAERSDILFVGGYRHGPNLDAARVLVQDVMPYVWVRRPATRVWLVGSGPPPAVLALASDRVNVPGRVPDLAPYYARARLTLSPLRFGAGVKGKIVESLAAGVPVVTTPIGAEGIGLTDGRDALLAATPAELADHAIRLLEDPTLAASLAAAGRTLVLDRFGPERMARALEAALAQGDARIPSETRRFQDPFASERGGARPG